MKRSHGKIYVVNDTTEAVAISISIIKRNDTRNIFNEEDRAMHDFYIDFELNRILTNKNN